jgi:hypothetical protein
MVMWSKCKFIYTLHIPFDKEILLYYRTAMEMHAVHYNVDTTKGQEQEFLRRNKTFKVLIQDIFCYIYRCLTNHDVGKYLTDKTTYFLLYS